MARHSIDALSSEHLTRLRVGGLNPGKELRLGAGKGSRVFSKGNKGGGHSRVWFVILSRLFQSVIVL